MRAVVQRVRWAEVIVDDKTVSRIENGLLVYVGIADGDAEGEAEYIAEKIAHLRIFPDEQDKLNCSVQDARGGILVVPNFTLLADARKGRRPAFSAAAGPEQARPIHDAFVAALAGLGCRVAEGVFGAHMCICSAADGPVNIILASPGKPA